MPTRPNVIPSVQLVLMLPMDIKTRLDLHLYSDLRGRVPKGAYQAFFVRLLKDYFDREKGSPNGQSDSSP